MTENKKKLVPFIRFSQFEEAWERKKLNKFLTHSKVKNKDLEFDKSEVLSVAAEAGVVNQIEYHGRSYAGVSVAPYGILRKGELVYTKSPLKAYPYGVIKFNDSKDGVVSTLYAIYKVDKSAHGKFLDYYFYYEQRINRYLKPLVNIGAKNDMKVNNDYVISDFITVPKYNEQQKIANFLTIIDNNIQQLTRKTELLKEYKKGVMQQLFFQTIRFTDEKGKAFPDWEYLFAKDIFKSHSNKNHDGDLTILAATQDQGMIPRDDTGLRIQSSESSVKSYKIVENGDFVISLRSFQGGIEYSNYHGICSPAYTILKPVKNINDFFYKSYFKKERFIERLSKTVVGIRDGKQISYSAFGGLKIPFPTLPEQQKIANFLNTIDEKIQLTQQQLDKMQTYKRGLLQQMFV